MRPYNFFDYKNGDSQIPVDFAIFGIPWDAHSTHIIGSTRSAPNKLREITSYLGRTTETGLNIELFDVADFGDVAIYQSLPERSKENIEIFIKELLPWKLCTPIPIMIGGDHYCSYEVIKNLNEIARRDNKGKFGVLIFDAHLDYYNKWKDVESNFHCTVTKRITDIPEITPDNVAVIGVRDIDINELEIANKDKLYFVQDYKLYPHEKFLHEIKEVISYFKSKEIENLYISIDIDVLNGSDAIGTPYTIPGSIKYRDLWVGLKTFISEFNIIGLDLVEVAPDLDTPTNLTQITAVKLIIETIGFIINKRDKK